MNLKSSVLFAVRMLLPKSSVVSNARKSLFGAVACIALSIVPLVVVTVVSGSMIEGITERIIGLSSYHLQIGQMSSFADMPGARESMETLRDSVLQVDGVTAAHLERQGIALAAGNKGRTGATVRAVEPELFSADTAFRSFVTVRDGVADISQPKTALIGTRLAETLGLSVGGTLRLITASPGASGNVRPKVSFFKVAGIVSCGYQELDALWVFVPLDSGYELFAASSSQVLVGIETDSPFSGRLQEIYAAVLPLLPPECRLYQWRDLNVSQFENFSSTKSLLLLIMSLIVLVASVNVSSALVMLVMERRREIAILKSIGASGSGISVSFLCIGTCVGALGVLVGIPLGLVCAVNINEIIAFVEKTVNFFIRFGYSIMVKDGFTAIKLLDPAYYLESVPVVVPFADLLIIAVLTLVLSLVVSVVPSVRAGKEKPLSILRKV